MHGTITTSRLQQFALIALIVFIGLFYLATLRPGAPVGDDFAMYILQARNIASGHWHAPTGYVYNPRNAHVGPVEYPPLFPLLLAPVYGIWGLHLTAMKVETLLFFLAALYAVFVLVSRELPFPYAAAIVVVVGLSPFCWEFKDNIVSDFPFFCLAMLALVIIDDGERRHWKSAVLAVAAGVTVYLSFATRTAGVVFLPGLAVSAIRAPRDGHRSAVAAAAVAVALMGAHSLVFRGNGSYLDQLQTPWQTLAPNARAYAWGIRSLMFGWTSRVPGLLLITALAVFAVVGVVLRARQGISMAETFSLFYALLLAVWRSEADVRLFLPLLPLWLMYVGIALRKLPRTARSITGASLLIMIAAGFALGYHRFDFGPIREGLGDDAFIRVCDYVREQTPPGSAVIFSRPRLMALVTGHSSSAYHQPANDKDLWDYFRKIHAGYLVVNRADAEDRRYLEPLLARSSQWASEQFTAGAFHLYAIR